MNEHKLDWLRAGCRPILVETIETPVGLVMVRYGEYLQDKEGHTSKGYAAYLVGGDGPFDRLLAIDAGLGVVKAKAKKIIRQPAAAPSPVPAPAPKPARLPAGAPTIAEQVGMSWSTLEKWVSLLADLERQRAEARALTVANRKAAQVWRQNLIAAGRVVPAQETA